jgi:hypothetical protein
VLIRIPFGRLKPSLEVAGGGIVADNGEPRDRLRSVVGSCGTLTPEGELDAPMLVDRIEPGVVQVKLHTRGQRAEVRG